jgi:hypothetical protein
MKQRRWLDTVAVILGVLSFLALFFFYAALHDIWHDYASPEVWSQAGQNLPDWDSPVNRCPLEWGFLQVGFLMMLSFHILLAVRWIRRHKGAFNSRPVDLS